MNTQHCPASHYNSFQVVVHETPMFRDLKLGSMPELGELGVFKSKKARKVQ